MRNTLLRLRSHAALIAALTLPLLLAGGQTAVAQPAEAPAAVNEQQRIGELDFLRRFNIDEARTLRADLEGRFAPGGRDYAYLRDEGAKAFEGMDFGRASHFFGAALAVADDDPAAWLDFARANNWLRSSPDWAARQQAMRDVSAAAINAYLRAASDDDKAEALMLIGEGMARREDWKPAIRAYRASLAMREDAAVRTTYEQALAEHGFRITGHVVDSDAAQPRICVTFSDDLPATQPGLTDFVVVEGGSNLAIEPEQRQICVDGVTHGNRYKLRVRAGLPAADGETLRQTAELDIYVRERAPWVGFAGNAYVLPAGAGASIPLSSVNTDTAKAKIYRIGARGLAGAVRDGTVLQQLNRYSADQIGEASGELVWEGEIGITARQNETVTTAIPIAEAIEDLKPGAYAITAQAATDTNEWGAVATQWFVVSDLGLTALSASDGVHVIVRSLATAAPVAEARLRLVAANNEVLGEAVTDADGYARFDPGLARGSGGMAPRLVDAENGEDYAFLDLGRSAFDLSDRGVDGRAAPGPLDVFMTSERGVYRPGESVFLTALVRDAKAKAVTNLPMTLVIERPDGVEHSRQTLGDSGAGGYEATIALNEDAMRGAWHARLFADPDGAALADVAVLVEDFEPERLAFDIDTPVERLSRSDTAPIEISARYLYGATAPGLGIAGDIAILPVRMLDGFANTYFGLADDAAETYREPIEAYAETDDDGKATLTLALPDLPATTRPLAADIILRLTDTNGRAVERTLSRAIEGEGPAIGIRPLFEGGDVPEGGPARFETIMIDAEGARIAASRLQWTLDRLETDYQWYRSGDDWRYEPVTSSRRIAAGTIDLAADAATPIEAPVSWGRYRLTVMSQGAEATASSYDFDAGWYVATTSVETPDVLAVALDKPAYAIGETARLRLDPRFAGIALISVIDNRLISMQAVEVPEDGTVVDLEVSEEWGPGAYVSATLYRPMDLEAKRMPARALGIAWAKVAPGERQLSIALDVAEEMRPRGPMTIPVSIGNLKPETRAFVTVAAVDVGILNLTGFTTPAPDDWYFGQRRLGVEMRDLYGMLIDRTLGEPGVVRSGGDGGPVRLEAPPPTQKLVAFHSGIVETDADGKASVSFDLPAFNGTVRIMAMAWTDAAVGHAEKDVLVRDPVVVAASTPRFLATRDESRLLVEMNNVAGAAGDYWLTVAADDGVHLSENDRRQIVTLDAGARASLALPIIATTPGDHAIGVTLSGPEGEAYALDLTLGVRPPGQAVTRRQVISVNGGGSLEISADALADFAPGTTTVTLSLGGAGRLDVAGILTALDRYPYGCAEQLTSRALPLLYLDEVAAAIGLGDDAAVRQRVEKAISGVLAKQSSSGGFGFWGPFDQGDLWLDAYVSDFLTRAAEHGYTVSDTARTMALDNLANRLAYAPDFDRGGEDVAYALYVLARAGRATLGDLRYYGEAKLAALATPLAKAQLGAALALYGDRRRSEAAFTAALADLDGSGEEDRNRWRADYGSKLRDEAAVLTLAAESRPEGIDVPALARRIALAAEAKPATSTQEQAWMMLAAAALIRDSARSKFILDGEVVNGALYRSFDGATLAAAPVRVENPGEETLDAMLTLRGVKLTPEPEGGNGFTIKRDIYTPEGEPADLANIRQNDRFVVVLTVVQDRARGGRLLVVDPIPAGFEIENPNLSASGDTAAYAWLELEGIATHTEARSDRYVAGLTRSESEALEFRLAYGMRAVSPGRFAQPGAIVEDMYRPEFSARSGAGEVAIAPAGG